MERGGSVSPLLGSKATWQWQYRGKDVGRKCHLHARLTLSTLWLCQSDKGEAQPPPRCAREPGRSCKSISGHRGRPSSPVCDPQCSWIQTSRDPKILVCAAMGCLPSQISGDVPVSPRYGQLMAEEG